ncbi:MAG: ABC transporter permease [Flavobacteriales bacterium]
MSSLRFVLKRDTWQEIFDSIGKNKTRTAITIVGVLWGIFLLIVLLGAARGMQNGFSKLFGDFATNSIFMIGGRSSVPYQGFQRGRPIRLNIDDIKTLRSEVSEIQFIIPRNSLGSWGTPAPLVSYGLQSHPFPVYGDYPLIDKVNKRALTAGRFLNENDMKNRRKVAVISEKDVAQLFEKDEDPIGKFIEINELYFQVIGVYHPNPNIHIDSDETIFTPFTTFQRVFNQGKQIRSTVMILRDNADAKAVQQRAEVLLKQLHHVSPKDTQAIRAFNMSENYKKLTGFLNGIQLLTIIVGMTTFIAGVIAIGNILLISVKERTREIGVRRALGATPGSIRRLILLEAVSLTLVAGLLGMVFGVGTLALLNSYVTGRDIPFYNPTVSTWFLVLSVPLMVMSGALIGLIPAQKAVRVRPIDALREA